MDQDQDDDLSGGLNFLSAVSVESCSVLLAGHRVEKNRQEKGASLQGIKPRCNISFPTSLQATHSQQSHAAARKYSPPARASSLAVSSSPG